MTIYWADNLTEVHCGDVLETLHTLHDDAVDLTMTSPPYMDARTYGIDGQRDCQEWIDWMLPVVKELCRVTKGAVCVNCAGVTRDWNYWPGPEGLAYAAFKSGIRQRRPAYWHRVGIPGSGGKDWLRADVEYVLCFTKCEGVFPWSDNTANGHPPKWAPGGGTSHRRTDGSRVNQWGHSIDTGGTTGTLDDKTCGPPRPSHYLSGRAGSNPLVPAGGAVSNKTADGRALNARTGGIANRDKWGGTDSYCNGRNADGSSKAGGKLIVRRSKADKIALGAKVHTKRDAGEHANGEAMRKQAYLPPILANPGVLVQGIPVGGGLQGHPLAHLNEAPFPVKLAEWFIRSWCPPGGTTLDPFGGSGTTAHAARNLGRKSICIDIRESQCELMKKRLAQGVLFA